MKKIPKTRTQVLIFSNSMDYYNMDDDDKNNTVNVTNNDDKNDKENNDIIKNSNGSQASNFCINTNEIKEDNMEESSTQKSENNADDNEIINQIELETGLTHQQKQNIRNIERFKRKRKLKSYRIKRDYPRL